MLSGLTASFALAHILRAKLAGFEFQLVYGKYTIPNLNPIKANFGMPRRCVRHGFARMVARNPVNPVA